MKSQAHGFRLKFNLLYTGVASANFEFCAKNHFSKFHNSTSLHENKNPEVHFIIKNIFDRKLI